jgi:hypothetical protein
MSSRQNKETQEKREQRAKAKVGQSQETYWDYAGSEAVKRVGKCPQAKGVIQEIAVRDSKNLSLSQRLAGETTTLTKSRTARSIDLVTTNSAGKVTSRIQVKDVVSSAGKSKLATQCAKGQYRHSRLVGSEETVAITGGSIAGKSISSSGISSRTTTRAADNAGVSVPSKNVLTSNLKDVCRQAKSAAKVGAAVNAVAEGILSYQDFSDGKISGSEYAGQVTGAAIVGAVETGGMTVAALTVKEAGKAVGKRLGCESLKRVAGSNAGTAVAFALVDQAIDTVSLVNGSIDGQTYGTRSVQNVCTAGGAAAGAAIGATLLAPIVGPTLGAVALGTLASVACSNVAASIGSWLRGSE